jgi:hypothetical protein
MAVYALDFVSGEKTLKTALFDGQENQYKPI